MDETVIKVNEIAWDIAGMTIRETDELTWRGKACAMFILAHLGDHEEIGLDRVAMPPDDDGSAGLAELLDWIERKRHAMDPNLRERLVAISGLSDDEQPNTVQIIDPQDAKELLRLTGEGG